MSLTNSHTHSEILPSFPRSSLIFVSYKMFLIEKKKKSSLGENEAEMARAAPALTSFDLQMLRARIFLPTAHEIWSRMWTAAGVSRGELLNSKMSCICWGLATQSRGLDAGGFSSFLIVSSPPGFVLLRVVFLKYWLKQTHFGQNMQQFRAQRSNSALEGILGLCEVISQLEFLDALSWYESCPSLNSCCRINHSGFPRNSADGLRVT